MNQAQYDKTIQAVYSGVNELLRNVMRMNDKDFSRFVALVKDKDDLALGSMLREKISKHLEG